MYVNNHRLESLADGLRRRTACPIQPLPGEDPPITAIESIAPSTILPHQERSGRRIPWDVAGNGREKKGRLPSAVGHPH
jgi:hypothetical protein